MKGSFVGIFFRPFFFPSSSEHYCRDCCCIW